MKLEDALAQRLRALCAQHKLSPAGLARASGISLSAIHNLLDGKTRNPSLRTLHHIAKALNLTVADLLQLPESVD